MISFCEESTVSRYPNGSNKFVLLKVFATELTEKTQTYLRQLKRLNQTNMQEIIELERLLAELEMLQLG